MSEMTRAQFEAVLDDVAGKLTDDLAASQGRRDPGQFEQHVRETLGDALREHGLVPPAGEHPRAFPDIALNGFGVEVKFTRKDSWLAVGNSVFEGMRTEGVEKIYVIFGKAGGEPEVRWGRYEECVTHVRVSHAPRFVIEMQGERTPLFDLMGVAYDEFRALPNPEKMHRLREHSRQRLRPGERLWWIEDEEPHAIPMAVRLYMELSPAEKRMLRAEAALLSPQVCQGRHVRRKYTDAALYLLTEHGVFCPQTRDLFSAGSVARPDGDEPGGNYILRGLRDIEDLMRDAARRLESRLFVEYWGADCPPERRIEEWLRRADECASDWRPSGSLFLDR